MDDVRIERILRAAECIPAGYVATYGDIGKVTGESARVVGNIMARWGSNVPWWRVCNAKGEIPGHYEQALPHWQAENLTLTNTGIALKQHRLPLDVLEAAWQDAVRDLEN